MPQAGRYGTRVPTRLDLQRLEVGSPPDRPPADALVESWSTCSQGDDMFGLAFQDSSRSTSATGRPRARPELFVWERCRRVIDRSPQETPCPRCGVLAPPGDAECTACGWDLREAYHDPLKDAAVARDPDA